MQILKFKLRAGFTLIELLVVIAIIGILISVATANFIVAQKQARDTRRMQDMESIQTSFETHFAVNGYYPDSSTIAEAFEGGLIPEDPTPSQSYAWNTDADSYCICASLETGTGNADGGTTAGCTWNSAGTMFCIQNKQ